LIDLTCTLDKGLMLLETCPIGGEKVSELPPIHRNIP
jgi:hypothetical protein